MNAVLNSSGVIVTGIGKDSTPGEAVQLGAIDR